MKEAISMSAQVAAVAPLMRHASATKRALVSSWVAAAIGCVAITAPLSPDDIASVALATEADCSTASDLSVVFVAIDGVRWQDVFEGTDRNLLGSGRPRSAEELAPHIHALARRGVAIGAPGHGEPFLASGPNFISLPGYTEMFTGRPAPCQENDCTDRPTWTLLDGFAAKGGTVGAVSSWSPIAHVVTRDAALGMVSAGRSGGMTRDRIRRLPGLEDEFDRGANASPVPGHGDYRPDAHTRAVALGVLRREPPRFLFVGLGDTDEHAHAGDYAAYLDALGTADRFVGDVMELAAEWKRAGRDTVIVVTTDHGRSADFRNHGRDYPESARGWLVAGGGPIPARGLVDSSVSRHLRDIAPTIAAMSGAPVEIRPDSGRVMTEMVPTCR